MSKFLTYPIWYDENGNLIEMLSGAALPAGEGNPLTNLAIGKSSVAGTSNEKPSNFGTAVGYQARAYDYSTALGSKATAAGGIAIGYQAMATGGGIGIGGTAIEGGIGIGGTAVGSGIGIGGTATAGKIQIGNSSQTYELTVGNGRMSLNIGSTDQGNWINAKSGGISQGLYLVRYEGNQFISLVYLMAPIAITDTGAGSTHTNDWYFPLATNTDGILYYLKVDAASQASALNITPVYYNKNTSAFVDISNGTPFMLFKIL